MGNTRWCLWTRWAVAAALLVCGSRGVASLDVMPLHECLPMVRPNPSEFGGSPATQAGKPAIQQAGMPALPRECVVLLHGLGRSAWSMKRLEWSLRKQGYQVINRSYASRQLTVEAAASTWLPALLTEQRVNRAARVHFVTHSLGGIIVRQFLQANSLPNLGRVVMIAPPNHGSEVVDKLRKLSLYKLFTGKGAAQQLGTGTNSVPQKLSAPTYEVGIIAGNRSLNPLFSTWLPGRDDGKVSVQSTRLDGMKEHLVVKHTHTWMMWKKDVLRAVSNFLGDGTFGATPAQPPSGSS